jgi:hypothetical protein
MVNRFFVTDAEANFFRVLRAVVGQRGHILAQVPLGRLVFFPGNNQSNPGRSAWQNKVSQKSIDFVVCEPQTLRPLVAIEPEGMANGECRVPSAECRMANECRRRTRPRRAWEDGEGSDDHARGARGQSDDDQGVSGMHPSTTAAARAARAGRPHPARRYW